ncbi:MAG: polyprenyl synthetase family protein [Thermomicrobiales bacterium]
MVTFSPAAKRISLPDTDALLAPLIDDAVGSLAGAAPLLSEMVRYHLGLDDEPPTGSDGRNRRGKRLRPALALLCCEAAGGRVAMAAPLAAAIELLHNFTLIHDDIQDQSSHRRHRPTVWHRWGSAQAINAGDALFAAAHLPLLRLPVEGVSPALTLRLIEAFDRMTIQIVQGQVSDLQFEGSDAVRAKDYLAMIGGKTAAIVEFAAWGGALVGGADDEAAGLFAAFGRSLGVGYQIRDDLLGIWGSTETTGKAAADDIRRRKQSLPILVLRERVSEAERRELDRLYGDERVDEAGVKQILALLHAANVRDAIEHRIRGLHDEAQTALKAVPAGDPAARESLLAMISSLQRRDG